MIDASGPEKLRRRTAQEKIANVQKSFEPGMMVSLVARQHGVAASYRHTLQYRTYHGNGQCLVVLAVTSDE